ncbi:hypothetical protein [Paracidovorax konjaci]|uniref:Type III effector protein n=1 Tax=Paracidovorax konjaci TaxID=32040 RepID=A0A1I1VDE6_9BURK|nr:hypothetical protein [Paracidovorax konjaci]SFD78480.1 hypothetical protein SAMN04489710_10677 [Paracidovorax konjaci]
METGNVNRSHRAQRGGSTPHETTGTGGPGRRAGTSASQGGAAAHIAPRAAGAGPSAGTVAQGRQPRASLPALARTSPPRMSDTAAGTVADKTMEYFKRFEASLKNPAIPPEDNLRALPIAFAMAQRALDAFQYMNIFQLRSGVGQFNLRYLLKQQAALACDLADGAICALDEKDAGSALMWRMQADQEIGMNLMPEFDRELDAHLEGLDGTLKTLEPWMAAAASSIKALGDMPDIKSDPAMIYSIQSAVVGLTGMRLKRIERHLGGIELCIQRLDMESSLSGTPAGAALAALKARIADPVELMRVLDLLMDARVPAAPEKVAQLQGQLDALLGAARAFVEAAGAQFPSDADGPPGTAVRVAQHILHSVARVAGEMEDALGAYKLPPSAVRHVQGMTYLEQATELQDAPLNPDDSADLPEKAEPSPEARASAAPPRQKAKAQARLRKPRAQEGGSGSSSAAAQAPQNGPLLQLARERLGGFKRPPEKPRVGSLDDMIAMGASLHKNTSALEAYRHEGSDPLETGNQMRRALDGWFGRTDRWESLGGQLQASQEAEGKGAAGDLVQRFEKERIAPLQQLHAQIDALELDRVKTFAHPRLKHVEYLMKADAQGQAMKIGAPRKLASQGDPDAHRGTVFEVELTPGKLSSGRPAPPLYVHLHTKEPVTAEACRSIAFDDLDAVHVKNADQRGKGRTWEALNNALDSVHRGPLDAAALKLLQERMGRG